LDIAEVVTARLIYSHLNNHREIYHRPYDVIDLCTDIMDPLMIRIHSHLNPILVKMHRSQYTSNRFVGQMFRNILRIYLSARSNYTTNFRASVRNESQWFPSGITPDFDLLNLLSSGR
jgi:hypothetical protein